MRTPKEIFDEELSGEPLTEESVIEVLKMYYNEAIQDVYESRLLRDDSNFKISFNKNFVEPILKLKIK